ncbi:MAG: dihydroorotate dehydrogenase electron transfer subunit [Gammaproteobacteria bacterium]|nr:dihydroorotate dehydrogenase electron transfer subunit [Gammaproteobacteria bacterium]NNF49415.1 dihydroorotate dehydrogenase electron transfer subunit [Woeseiaceae bacterium]MBT8093512.1 dihydroorotate dehydrogenase electron transfer subunit [Gammaproteobacteria bacterium]MBT8106524.1 dihydroorotate dehydrogenase electron transfer subunit [Gammaproteobacteria bacterium]NNK26539.1 dihydroorotate dehydrogenase electron transfer subunit [Woeseiaceae bacterium]
MALSAAQQKAQENRDTIFVEDGEVVAVDTFAGEQFIMRIRAPKCAADAEPGSFVHLTCDESLPMRRPLSIMRTDEDCIDVLYKIVGEGLRLLARKKPGDTISVLGPIGKPFEFNEDRPNTLLIGGGVGIPPMVFIAERLRHEPGKWQPFAILGSEIPFPFELQASRLVVPGVPADVSSTMPLLEDWGIPARLTSLQGYDGCFEGYVTVLADAWLDALPLEALAKTEIFACGPTPMLRAVADLAARHDLPCQVSLEEFMACAVGGCAGCAVRIMTPAGEAMKRVCVDGPVFDAASVVW